MLPVEGLALCPEVGDDGVNADHGAGELVEACQYIHEEIAPDRDLSGLSRLVPHIIVCAEEDR